MVIGFDGSRSFLKEKTGTENYSYQLLKALAKIDRKNKYVVYIRPGLIGGAQQSKLPSNFRIRVINLPRLWTQIGLASQTFKDHLDVLFIPAHTIPIIKKPGLKTVVTVHDLGSEYLPRMHQLKQRLYLGLMQRYQLKNATKIIAVSQSTKKDLVEKIGLDSKKISVIYEGVDTEQFKPARNDILIDTLNQYELRPNNYFIFVGTIQPRKNLRNLINAYDSFYGPFKKSPKLVLAGSKGWLSDDIYKLVRILDLTDKVKFIGRVTDDQLRCLYSGAIGLVYPSLFEGFGLPVLEAFACGCPVICSDSSSLPEVAGSAAIMVDAYNINDIARGMDNLLIRTNVKSKDYREQIEFKPDKLKRSQWIKKGLIQVKQFSWEKCARETLAVLETV